MEEGRSFSTGSEKKKVMVAIDESESSHNALEWTLNNLHHSVANSEVLIYTVQPIADYSYLYASSSGAAPPELIKSFQEQHQRTANALLEKAKHICGKYGVVAKTATEVGNPKESICEAVEKFKVQLLVVGSHGRGALKRAFLGSVSNYCVHNAKSPVLVISKPYLRASNVHFCSSKLVTQNLGRKKHKISRDVMRDLAAVTTTLADDPSENLRKAIE